MKRYVRVTLVTLAAFVSVAWVVGSNAAGAGYRVDTPIGVTGQMTPEQVASKVTAFLAQNASIALSASTPTVATKIDQMVLARPDEVGAIEPRAAGISLQRQSDPAALLWVVRAHGAFVTQRGRSMEPRVFASGYLIIDDATGDIVGMGMP